jgi:thiamine-monophosphate kinase
MGWVAIMACLSDLAAVGADPLGVVVSVSLESTRDEAFRTALAQGMSAACDWCGTFLLGGDTNAASAPALTGCAIGIVPRVAALTRVGCRPGDVVFLSGPAGAGSALGVSRFLGTEGFPENNYRPVARLNVRHTVRRFATACMDTSDGLLPTLDQLMRLNGMGFRITCEVAQLLDPRALRLAVEAGLPPWFMLAGPHGEFELVLTVPQGLAEHFMAEARSAGWEPVMIGTVTEEVGVRMTIDGRQYTVDTAGVRNLFDEVSGDISRYVRGLAAMLVPEPEV